jgi:hypothetical protein
VDVKALGTGAHSAHAQLMCGWGDMCECMGVWMLEVLDIGAHSIHAPQVGGLGGGDVCKCENV